MNDSELNLRRMMSTNNGFEDRLLTADEAAAFLGFKVGTIYNKVSRDEIPHLHIGRSVRFRLSDLNGWIAGQQDDSAEAA